MDDNYKPWLEFIRSQLAVKLDCAQLTGLYLPQMVGSEIPQRRRVTLVLITLFSNVVKHHLRCIVKDSKSQGTVRTDSLAPGIVAVAVNDLSVVWNRQSLVVENYAGHSEVGPVKTEGTYRDLESYLSGVPILGSVAEWKIEKRADHYIVRTKLTLTEEFWKCT